MEPVRTVQYKGKTIHIVDVSETKTTEESVAVLQRGEALIKEQPPKSVLLITDVSNARYDVTGIEAMKNFSYSITSHVRASAVVGVSGMKSVFLKSIIRITGRNIKPCEDVDEAKEWLITQ